MKIKGKISSFLFKNENYGIAIFTLIDKKNKTLVIKGNIATLALNLIYELEGENVIDFKTNKPAFEVNNWKLSKDFSKEIYIKYLSSSLFPTIGKRAAEAVVEYYQDDIFNKILKNKQDLTKITELSSSQRDIIFDVTNKYFGDEKILDIFVKKNLKLEIFNFLKKICLEENEMLSILQNDFYEFAIAHKLKSFEDIDNIAIAFGVEKNSPLRVSWWAFKIGQDLLFETGNTWFKLDTLLKKLRSYFLDLKPTEIEEKLIYAKNNKILIFDNGKIDNIKKIYTYESYNDEVFIANTLNNLSNKQISNFEFDFEDVISQVETYVGETLNISNFKYNKEQKNAFKNFFNNNISIITGGPGTGKTTVIIGLIKFYKLTYEKKSFSVMTPTGKAANRININNEFFATTIHKFLRATGNDLFEYNEFNPISKNLLIIDECSMIDNHLFTSLLKGVVDIDKLVLVGDKDQLPSVGYGNLYEDIIKSAKFAITELKINNRQIIEKENNSIIDLADAIKNNVISQFDFKNTNNVEFIFDANPESVIDIVKEIYLKNNPTSIEEQLSNIQIIAPMYKNFLGINNLNVAIQQLVNKNLHQGYKKADSIFMINDKIMNTENDSSLEIYNGDVGYIKELNFSKNKLLTSKLVFNSIIKEVNAKQFMKIILSYACSVHKTQGSEYNTVIMVLDPTNYFSKLFLNKKMIYTGITRAKQKLYIISSKELFISAASKEMKKRETSLTMKLIENL